MLTLNDGRSELWQWDTGRTLAVDADCSQVHFSNKVFGRSIDVDVTAGVAIIPDILLQTDKDLNVWAFVGTADNGYTKISKTFKVNRRNKPSDYVFTPQEQILLKDAISIVETAKRASNDAIESAKQAKDSSTQAAKSSDAAADSASAAAGSAVSAGNSASAAARSERASGESEVKAAESEKAAKESEQAAAQSAAAADKRATDAENASKAAASSAAAAKNSAIDAASAAKIAGDAATKVINYGVAEKLTEMQGIQEDVKARQQDVTEKQADVTANVELARQAALSNGYMQMGVDENGHLMYTRTTNLKDKIDFAIVNDTNLEVQIHG